jgi:thiaminase/transcriptional activator TenA
MRVTEMLRGDCAHIWSRIMEHPFVLKLYDGTLPEENFRYYILQDYNYLVGLMRCMCVIASKSDARLMQKTLALAQIEATTELENYQKMLSAIGLSMGDAISAEPAPTNVAYMNFLLSTAYTKSSVEGLTALLPCFWSYVEIAEKNRDRLKMNKNNLYKEWASLYLTEETKGIVEELREIVDSVEHYDSAREIFLTASRYEYMFWDMAHNLERWVV